MVLKANAGLLFSERWSRHPFPYSSHQLQLKTEMLHVKHTETLKGKDKKAVTLRASGHEEWQGVSSLGFLFASLSQAGC